MGQHCLKEELKTQNDYRTIVKDQYSPNGTGIRASVHMRINSKILVH